jgi:hypothetical protein
MIDNMAGLKQVLADQVKVYEMLQEEMSHGEREIVLAMQRVLMERHALALEAVALDRLNALHKGE